MKKRMISLVLVLMMVLTLIPFNNTYGDEDASGGSIGTSSIKIVGYINGFPGKTFTKIVTGNDRTAYFTSLTQEIYNGEYIISAETHSVSVKSKDGEMRRATVNGSTYTLYSGDQSAVVKVNLVKKPRFTTSNVQALSANNYEYITATQFKPTTMAVTEEYKIAVVDNTQTKPYTLNKPSIGNTPVSVTGYTGSYSDYKDYVNKIFVTEGMFNKNLISYSANISVFFSDKGVLPPSTDIVDSIYKDVDKNGEYTPNVDKKLAKELSVDYRGKIKAMEDNNMLNSSTSIVNIRQLIGLYLYTSPTYLASDDHIIDDKDVEIYVSYTPNNQTYSFPTNIPYYDESGKFVRSYNIAKDSRIVDGRNQVLEYFLNAYDESYNLAYNNDERNTEGLRVKYEGSKFSQELNNIRGMKNIEQTIANQKFKMLKNGEGKLLDFELFAMSMNQARTIIAFRENVNEFIDYKYTPTAASLGYGLIKAPVTNLLYTGGVANEKNTDYAEYPGYYNTPYITREALSHVEKLLEIPPKMGNGMYLKDIVDTGMREDLKQSIKTGIREIDDKTGARSFNPDVWFAYLDIWQGKILEEGIDGYTRNKAWSLEDDMKSVTEGLFYKEDSTSKVTNETFTRIVPTEAYKQAELKGLLNKKEEAFLDHIVITEFPTMYTWGQGVAVRINSGGQKWYVDVALAPISLTRDVEVYVEGDTLPADGGAYQTKVRVRFDTMPYLPVGLDSENIAFNVLGKDIEVVSVASTDVVEGSAFDRVEGGNFKYVQYSQYGYDRKDPNTGKVTTYYDRVWDGTKDKAYYDKLVTVTWKPKATATADSKIIFTANLVDNATYTEMVKNDDVTLKTARAEIAEDIKSQLDTVNNAIQMYAGTTVKYPEIYLESRYDNNYAMLPVKATVDLGLYGYNYDYDEGTKKTTIDIIGFLTGRELVGAELPVEVTLSWETWDGQIGTLTKTSSTLKAGKAESFIFNPNIVPDASGVAPGGTFKVEINPRNVPAELDRTNNVYEGVEFGPKPINGIDFEIYAPFVSFPIVNDGSSATTQFKAYVTLNNTTETKNTVISLYKMDGAKLIADKNVTVVGGNSLIVDFTVPLNQLAEGSNNLRLVVREL